MIADKSELSAEKELLNEELRLAYARVSELEIFIDRMKLGQKPPKRSSSSDQLSKLSSLLSKSASNLRPFDDESRLESSSSLMTLDRQQPSKSEANLHHAALLEDLHEKQQIIDKLEDEIDRLRGELDQNQSSGKSVDSLLHDISERENQIFVKNEELLDWQNQVEQLRDENQNLKDKLSELINKGFDPSNPETYTIEEPVTKVASSRSLEAHSKSETEIQMEQLIERSKTQDDVISKLQEQVKLLRDNQVIFRFSRSLHYSSLNCSPHSSVHSLLCPSPKGQITATSSEKKRKCLKRRRI